MAGYSKIVCACVLAERRDALQPAAAAECSVRRLGEAAVSMLWSPQSSFRFDRLLSCSLVCVAWGLWQQHILVTAAAAFTLCSCKVCVSVLFHSAAE